ncbi:hypothetical protein BDD12DRAFT_901616 [Trichophaea hybrida]|nr:hypothetical protein BDD12DRAFT_901616 [Trichophaea hybrida]
MLRDRLEGSLVELDKHEAFAAEQGRVVTPAIVESAIAERRILIANSIGEAWKQFSYEKRDLIIHAFQKTGIALPVDGSMDSIISIRGFTAENLVVIGDWQKQLHSNGTETEIELDDLNSRDSGPDTSVIFLTDEDGDIDGGDESLEFTAQVEEWTHTFNRSRSRPQTQRLVDATQYTDDEDEAGKEKAAEEEETEGMQVMVDEELGFSDSSTNSLSTLESDGDEDCSDSEIFAASELVDKRKGRPILRSHVKHQCRRLGYV